MKIITLRLALLLLSAILISTSIWAAEPSVMHYTQTEIKTIGLSIAKTLRCPMSTNQNLLDSQAPIANELKAEIFLQLEQGRSEAQIIDFMVQRYGEKIRYMPNLAPGTMVLFLFPLFLVALIAAWALWLRRSNTQTQQPLSLDTHHD